MLKLFCSLSAVYLLFGLSEASKKPWWNPEGHAVLDRTLNNYTKPGFYVTKLDVTAFAVDQPVWLERFNISKVFYYNPAQSSLPDIVPVKVKIIEILKINTGVKKLIYTGKVEINSTYEGQVTVPSLPLKPGYVYEIHLEMPENWGTVLYIDAHAIKEFKVRKYLLKYFYVNFYQHNTPLPNPPANDKGKLELSGGMVKRLYFKYLWF